MLNTSVAVINASTVLRDDDVAAAVPALQKQVSEHLSAVWGIDATLNFVQQGASPPPQGHGGWPSWITAIRPDRWDTTISRTKVCRSEKCLRAPTW